MKSIVICPVCRERQTAKGLYLHHRKMHPQEPWPGVPIEREELVESSKSAASAIKGNSNGLHRGPEPAGRPIKGLEIGALTTIQPKTFSLSSSLLYQTKVITETEWNWPVMEPGQWVDTFFFRMMLEHGWVIGGYVRINNDGSAMLPNGLKINEEEKEEEGEVSESEVESSISKVEVSS